MVLTLEQLELILDSGGCLDPCSPRAFLGLLTTWSGWTPRSYVSFLPWRQIHLDSQQGRKDLFCWEGSEGSVLGHLGLVVLWPVPKQYVLEGTQDRKWREERAHVPVSVQGNAPLGFSSHSAFHPSTVLQASDQIFNTLINLWGTLIHSIGGKLLWKSRPFSESIQCTPTYCASHSKGTGETDSICP